MDGVDNDLTSVVLITTLSGLTTSCPPLDKYGASLATHTNSTSRHAIRASQPRTPSPPVVAARSRYPRARSAFKSVSARARAHGGSSRSMTARVIVVIAALAIVAACGAHVVVADAQTGMDDAADLHKLREQLSTLTASHAASEKTVADLRLQLDKQETEAASNIEDLTLKIKESSVALTAIQDQMTTIAASKDASEKIVAELRLQLDQALASSVDSVKLAQNIKDTTAALSSAKSQLSACETTSKATASDLEDARSKNVVLKDALRVSEEGRNNAEAYKPK